MRSVIEQLEVEWERLAVDQRAARRLGLVCAAAGGAANLAEVEAYVCQASPAAADVVLVALVGPASDGGQLEARVLLQLLLPGVRRMARRWWALGTRDEREAAAVAAVWQQIRCYRLDRRPAKVAINILLDAEKELRRSVAKLDRPIVDLASEPPAPAAPTSPGEELMALLRDAVAAGALSVADARIIAAFRIGGHRIAEIGEAEGRSERTIKRRRRAAERTLVIVASAA